MNAHKFVAENGIEEAKRVLEGAPDWANYYSTIDGEYYLIELDAVNLKQLKQVVESLGVICRACGAERIIELHNMYKSNPVGHEYWLEVSVDRMIKAIEDYELVESYKGEENG